MMQKMLGRVFVLHKKILPNDIKNEMIVETMSGEKLRLNVYPTVKLLLNYVSCISYNYNSHSTKQLKTVNGIRIIEHPRVETDLVVIYRVTRFPMAAHEDRDIIETLNGHKARLSTLLHAIEVANLTISLKKGINE